MTVKVRVQNFQSLKDVSLEIDRLTVITGPNNSGKSAFVRAVIGAFQNTKGASFVRRGTSHTQVDLEFADGRSLTWEKGPKSKPKYIIDGGDPIYPGAGVPDEVRALGVRPVQAGGGDLWPQIARQFHQVFLIDQPGSVLAEAVADVDRVTHLNEALKSAKSDQTKASSTLQVRQDDVKKLSTELKTFEGLDAVGQDLKLLEQALLKVSKAQQFHEVLSGIETRLNASLTLVASLEPVEQVDFPGDSVFDEPRKMLGRQEELRKLEDRWVSAKKQESQWSGLVGIEVPSKSETEEALKVLSELLEVRKLHSRLQAARLQESRWKGLEGVTLEADDALASKVLGALNVLLGFNQRLGVASENRVAQEARVKEAEVSASEAEQELQRFLAELGECPICGNAMDLEHREGHP